MIADHKDSSTGLPATPTIDHDTGGVRITPTSTAAAPAVVQLSDGAATYTAAKTGQLPAALGAGGGLKVDGSGTALPISAASLPLPSAAATSVKQDDQTAALELINDRQADGTQKAILRGGAKGATTAADVTSTANGADHQGIDVVEQFAPGYEDGTNNVAATQNKPLAVSTYAWSTDVSAALEASSVTKNTAGVLRSGSWRLDGTAPNGTYYLQVLNAASLPADGVVTHLITPLKLVVFGGDDVFVDVDLTDNGVFASAGIVWCLSTTEFTKTIAGAYLAGTVLFK